MAWFVMPVMVAWFTTPELMTVLRSCPPETVWKITLLGAAYGFGGMAFGVAIRYIGFSLTYAITIGISAVVGTVVPALQKGTLVSDFQKPGAGLC
jgi:L-rhamnose-H+ transport protein